MSYTLAVHIRNPRKKELMKLFLNRYYAVPTTGIKDVDFILHNDLSLPHDTLDYDKSPYALGFDYKTGIARPWGVAVIKWIARRVGSKRKGSLYYVYEGCEEVEITNKNYLDSIVHSFHFARLTTKEQNIIVTSMRKELRILSKRWKVYSQKHKI